jgi:hypothetical protein
LIHHSTGMKTSTEVKENNNRHRRKSGTSGRIVINQATEPACLPESSGCLLPTFSQAASSSRQSIVPPRRQRERRRLHRHGKDAQRPAVHKREIKGPEKMAYQPMRPSNTMDSMRPTSHRYIFFLSSPLQANSHPRGTGMWKPSERQTASLSPSTEKEPPVTSS